MWWSNTRKVITHSGNFHPDEIMGCAILSLLFKENIEIIRTRDQDMMVKKDTNDIVLDVGYQYNPTEFRFDHHQPDFKEKRDNGIGYASCGLIWKHFGDQLTNSSEISERIDKKLIQTIDAGDVGIELAQPIGDHSLPYDINHVLTSFRPTWKEISRTHDEGFFEAVELAKKILTREIALSSAYVEGKQKVLEAYECAEDKRIIVIDGGYSWGSIIEEKNEPLYVVLHSEPQTTWAVKCVNVKDKEFESRKLLPEAWAGKTGKEFEMASGVLGANFCHTARFIAVSNSKEGALALAKLAVEA